MFLIDPGKLEVNDVVLVKRLLEGDMNFLVGRVVQTDCEYRGKIHIVIWGGWREERTRTAAREFYTFQAHFDREEPGLMIYRIGKWVNGQVKNRENEACYILGNLLMELKSTGLIRVSSITETERFLGG